MWDFKLPSRFCVFQPFDVAIQLSVKRGKGTGSGEIKGTMAFDRKDYGIDGSIPFIKIADRVQVDVDLKAKRTSGPPLTFKQ